MRILGGILVASLLVSACADSTAVESTGSVRFVVAGLEPLATSGGRVSMIALDDSTAPIVNVDVPRRGDSGELMRVPVGAYQLAYTPPVDYAFAGIEPNPKEVVVSGGEEATATWTVGVASAILRIEVTGLGADESVGGTISVLRTDVANRYPVVRTITANGTTNLGVMVGTYRITLQPPPAYVVDSGVPNPQEITITDGQDTTAAFSVAGVVVEENQ
jgi:hypothetical protein